MKDMKRGVRRWNTKKIHRKRLKEFYDAHYYPPIQSYDEHTWAYDTWNKKRRDSSYSETPCQDDRDKIDKQDWNRSKILWLKSDQWIKDYIEECDPITESTEWGADWSDYYACQYGYWCLENNK